MRSVPSRFREPSIAVRMFAGLLSSAPGPPPAWETKPNFVASTTSRDVRVPVDRGTGAVSQERAVGSTLDLVDTKKEIRDFLTSRRARITPEQGLRSYGSRRVPGLRREEVVVLAGVSVPYYTRL